MNPAHMKSMTVNEFLNPVEVYSPEDYVAKVIGSMRDHQSYESFVEDGDRTGMVTIRDILNVGDITTTRLSTVMSYVPRLNKNNTVEDVASLMFEYRIRSIPVYEDSHVLGQVNATSILKRLMDTKQEAKMSSIMTPDPITVSASDRIGKARGIMLRRKIDHIPFLLGSKLSGVVTSSDIVFNMIPQPDRIVDGRFEASVEDYFDGVTVSNEIRDSLNTVFENMVNNRVYYSVITNMDEIQGIVTFRDYMRMVSHSQDSKDSIPMYIVGLPEDPFEAEASREKFTRIVQLMRKANPEITEARAIIKSGKVKGAARQKFEVQIFILTPRNHLSYKAAGFELPDVFDNISSWAKKLVGKSGEEWKGKRRVRSDPGRPTE